MPESAIIIVEFSKNSTLKISIWRDNDAQNLLAFSYDDLTFVDVILRKLSLLNTLRNMRE